MRSISPAAILCCLTLVFAQSTFAQIGGNGAAAPAECDLSGANGSVAACNGPTAQDAAQGYKTITAAITPPANGVCPTGSAGPYCGARSAIGMAVAPIDAWGTCRWIDNTGTTALFVPFRTVTEWSAFITAASTPYGLPGIALTPCAEPYIETGAPASAAAIPVYPNDTNPGCGTPLTRPAPNVYGRVGAYGAPNTSIWPITGQNPAFTCHNGNTTIGSNLQWVATTPSWTQNFTYAPDVILIATDNSNGNSSSNTISPLTIIRGTTVTLAWTTDGVTGQTYSCAASGGWMGTQVTIPGTANSGNVQIAPDADATYILTCTDNNRLVSTASVTVNVIDLGVCGSSNGQSLAAAPTTNLCADGGSASAVSSTSNGWTWTCTPADNNLIGGHDAETCIATIAPVDGACGSSNGATLSSTPTNLCTVRPTAGA